MSQHSDAQAIQTVRDDTSLFPSGLIHAGFLEQSRRSPQATAVVWEESGTQQSLSYKQLRDRAWSVAQWIRAQAACTSEPGVVAVLLPKGWAQIATVLGINWAGFAYIPLDTSWPAARILEVLTQTGCKLVLSTAAVRRDLAIADHLSWLDFSSLIPRGDNTDLGDEQYGPASPGDLAYVIYTSGSTGRPKGVMMEHRAVSVTLSEVIRRWGVGCNDRVLALSSLSFDLSVFDIYGVLAAGGAVIIPQENQRRDPAALLRLASNATVWNSVPALAQMVIDHLDAARAEVSVWPRPLRLMLLSGDWIPVGLPIRIRKYSPQVSIVSLGGATEAGIWSIAYDLDNATAAEIAEWRSVPYGRALAGQTVQVLRGGDDRAHDVTPCGPWVVGRIYIGGGAVARGYWGDPEQTNRRFIRHPQTGARLYDTGDLGRTWPDGTIELLGRADRQVKIQGYRVEPAEVETVLMRHPAVSACAVKAFEGASGSMKLAAYVVPLASAGTLDIQDLRKFLAEDLPPYMLPLIQPIPELPRNANDKVDLAALPNPVVSSAVVDAPADGSQLSRLQSAAQEVLKISSIAPDANLLELGANSADVLSIISRIEGELGVEVDIEAFFANPTLRAMVQPGHATAP